MDKKATEQILLGAVEVYITNYDSSVGVPKDEELEVEANNVGHTSGGTTVECMPEKYDVQNSYGEVVKSVIRSFKATIKFGMLMFNAENIKRMNNAKVEYSVDGTDWTDKETGATKKRIRFDNKYNLDTLLVRLVHTKSNGEKIRTTMIGQGGNGFTSEYSENEMVIDAQIDSIKANDDFVLEIVEDYTPGA